MLTRKGTSREETHLAVQTITEELSAHLRRELLDSDELILLPVLRAAIAMWPVMNREFHSPVTHFCVGDKVKGTDRVDFMWLKTPPHRGRGANVVILDTVVATGDTILRLLHDLEERNILEGNSLHLLSCYASPIALERIGSKNVLRSIIVGVVSEGVDSDGYLIPRTNGDIGEKLFESGA